MDPTLQELPSRLVVGLGAKFISVLSPKANNFEVIPKLWNEFVGRLHEISHRVDKNALGCVFCAKEGQESLPGELYYLACVEVSEVADIPAGMEWLTIPAGAHAVFVHNGKLDTLCKTMAHIHGVWLPNSGRQWRQEAPEVEIYDDKFDPGSDDSELRICIPVT